MTGGFNGSGTFVRSYNWQNDASNSVPITASRMDTEDNGFASGLSNCITRDGQSPALANIPMGGYKITGLGAGSSGSDSVTYNQVFGSGSSVGPGLIPYDSAQAYSAGTIGAALKTLYPAFTTNNIATVDMGTSSVPAMWLKTSLGAAWPGLLIENTKHDAAGQVQIFWKRWDASGNPLVWQAALDVDNNGGFKGLFNIEAVDITGPGVICTPFSAARSGEVGIGTGVPVSGQQLTVGGDVFIRRSANTAVDGALWLGSGGQVSIYGNGSAHVLSFATTGSEVARFVGGNLLIGSTTDTGEALQVTGAVKAGNATVGTLTASPAASATPASNGQMTFELTSNTTLKIKVKGSDGTVRSVSLTLA